MLFNSYVFILAFLPATALGFYALGRASPAAALLWLLLCSLVFYGYWNPAYLPLLLLSIGGNYACGTWIARLTRRGDRRARVVLAAGVAANLAALGYFKYANFVVANVDAATGAGLSLAPVVLPLAISFFTFQQIAYLVDTARGERRDGGFLHYCLFVSFFPQLIAGPIVHYRETAPQFAAPGMRAFVHDNFAVGVTLFVIGLFKKVALADGMAVYASPVFAAAGEGTAPTFIEAWGGALAYTLQLYFDFSGYSDMAIGLGLMFNIRLPINFNAPYKARNIIDFWRRWHITLSHFLRDYLYVALGGNRRGPARRYANLLLTMLLGGLWHGAGWTFVAWGALHGVMLVANHFWHALRVRAGFPARAEPPWWGLWTGRAVTLLAVIVAWVIFRASSLEAAGLMLQSMAGLNGVVLPSALEAILAPAASLIGARFDALPLFRGPTQAVAMAALLAVVLLAPASHQLVGYAPAFDSAKTSMGGAVDAADRPLLPLRWRPAPAWAATIAAAFVYVLTQMSNVSEFLYFQF